jgi:hypothetical protein
MDNKKPKKPKMDSKYKGGAKRPVDPIKRKTHYAQLARDQDRENARKLEERKARAKARAKAIQNFFNNIKNGIAKDIYTTKRSYVGLFKNMKNFKEYLSEKINPSEFLNKSALSTRLKK